MEKELKLSKINEIKNKIITLEKRKIDLEKKWSILEKHKIYLEKEKEKISKPALEQELLNTINFKIIKILKEFTSLKILILMTTKEIDKNKNILEQNTSTSRQSEEIVDEETALLQNDINSINNNPMQTNGQNKCCPSCIIL